MATEDEQEQGGQAGQQQQEEGQQPGGEAEEGGGSGVSSGTTTTAGTDTLPPAPSADQEQPQESGGPRPYTGKKRGTRKGTRVFVTKSPEDWYNACHLYRHLTKNDEDKKKERKKRKSSSLLSSATMVAGLAVGGYGIYNPVVKKKKKKSKPTMSQIAFLKSTFSGPKFKGTESESNSFSQYLKKYDDGSLRPRSSTDHEDGNGNKRKTRKFEAVESRLVEYIEHLRCKPLRKLKKNDLAWASLRRKAMELHRELVCEAAAEGGGTMMGQQHEQQHQEEEEFTASDGWLSDVLKRHGIVGVTASYQEDDDDNGGGGAAKCATGDSDDDVGNNNDDEAAQGTDPSSSSSSATAAGPMTYLQAHEHVTRLKRFCDDEGLSLETKRLLDLFVYEVQQHRVRSTIATASATNDHQQHHQPSTWNHPHNDYNQFMASSREGTDEPWDRTRL